jgi:hypothetical protein
MKDLLSHVRREGAHLLADRTRAPWPPEESPLGPAFTTSRCLAADIRQIILDGVNRVDEKLAPVDFHFG